MNQFIHVDSIIVTPGRQRIDFDPQGLAELGETISSKGLMHAIVLREVPEGLALVAGERRLRAVKDMAMLGQQLKFNGKIVPEDHIPYVTLGQLTPLEAEEAELDENLHRKDLTWQENAAAMAKLHSLRSRQAQAEGRIHTVADTALETKGRSDGSFQEAVRKDLIVARYLHNPEIAKAKSTDEAFKILKRNETTAKNIALGESVGKTFTASVHQVYNTNCLSWMATAAPEQFDVILTDPPYGMGADNFGDGGGGRLANNEHHYKDDLEGWRKLMTAWCPLAFAVAKREAHAYVFCDLDNFHELKAMMKAAGWYVFRTPMICTKPNSGRVPLPDEGPRRQWEMILYAIKGHKKTTAIYPDVITTNADAGLQHGAQKPVALFEDLLRRSVRPGDTVLDSFAGSGTIFPAAHSFKVKATGLEMSPEYYGVCLKRLEDLNKPVDTSGVGLGNELKELMGL
jgi:site-specific DNA-methyltransferase (adenine-specific)